jgi:hypothetical protein
MIVLRQIFIGAKADTGELISAILGLISICVALVASLHAKRLGRSTKAG